VSATFGWLAEEDEQQPGAEAGQAERLLGEQRHDGPLLPEGCADQCVDRDQEGEPGDVGA
jgi:hypothetical protein